MPSKTIIKYAMDACKKSSCEYQLAAVLYKSSAVIRVVYNENKTLGYRKKYFSHGEPSRHAELSALHNMPKDVTAKCSLLVVRVNRLGELKSAKPCIACAQALKNAGVKKVYYSSYSGEILKLDFNELSSGNYSKEQCDNY